MADRTRTRQFPIDLLGEAAFAPPVGFGPSLVDDDLDVAVFDSPPDVCAELTVVVVGVAAGSI